ncbi:F-box/LRR-repeat protein At4g14103-like [Coffea arabica]|uniref:F-box/LRR-repeat protein At4g14103-like n=1 Tax=Coffea arabica TaxID=13443 RepID=A0ABM4W2V7_COFAR
MAERNPKCLKASFFPQNDQNPSEKSAVRTEPMKANLSPASADDNCQEDRFSALPDHILFNILSFLRTKEAASTSILSTRWRYIFLDLPNIDLDDYELVNTRRLRGDESDDCYHDVMGELEEKFIDFVDRLVMHRESPLSEFHFSCGCGCLTDQTIVVRSWLSSVLSRNVQVIDVRVKFYGGEFWGPEVFPSEILTCETLVVLKLDGNVSLKVPKLLCLPNLRVLHLDTLTLLGDSTGSTLKWNCPLLDDLRIDLVIFCDVGLVDINLPSLTKLVWASQKDKVVLNTPKLECLEYRFYESILSSNCKFKFLTKADLRCEYPDALPEHLAHELCQLFGQLCNVKHLDLRGCSLESLLREDHLLPEFLNLTHLVLKWTWIGSWKFLEILLWSAPNLEMLVFELMRQFDMASGIHLHCGAKEKPHCLSQHLREVKIMEFVESHQLGFEIVSYFLKHGAGLQKMTMYHSRTSPTKWSSSTRKKLMELSRCSRNCEIVLI